MSGSNVLESNIEVPMQKKVIACIFFCILILDQATKYVALYYLNDDIPRSVIPGFFDLVLVFNKGAAFGMFSDWPDALRWTALGVVSVVALIVVFRLLLWETKGDRVSQAALSAVLAGACGNVIDRARFDAVVDFLDFYYGTYHWPAFNIADSAISVGVAVLMLRMVFPFAEVDKLNQAQQA